MEQLSFANSQAFCNPILHRYASSSSPKSSRVHHDHQLTTLIFSRLDYIPRHMTDLRTVHRQSQPTTLHPKPRQVIKPNKSQSAQGVQDKQLGWNPLQKMAAKALDMVEMGLIEKLERQRPLPGTADPAVQLAGNFFPVPEHPVQHKLEVKGTLPEGLEGVYVRNGANPMYRPVGGHHLFDGDGMLHAVRISHGVASYANRFTRTHRLKEEERLGRPIFPKAIGELHGHTGIARLLLFYARCLLGLVDGSHGMGVANAGVVFFHGHLLAMSEDDLPYVVHTKRNGDLHTLGKFDFHGQLHNSSMIAHPKVDWKTGELFALSYDVIKKPYLKYFSFKKDGMKACEVSIADVSEPTMVHDFAITKNFVVIPDQQVIFKLPEMLLGHSPVLYTKDKMPRFGILPRNAINDHNMKWINVPECFCFHLWNAWEEGDNVVVIGSCMTPPDSIFNESKGSFQSILTEIRINLTSLTSCQRVISPSLNLEAGQVNRKLLGRKTQYAYLAIAQPWPKVCGVAKVDLLSMKDSIQTNINSLASYLDGEENASLGQLSQLSGGDGGHEGALTNHQLLENNVVASFIYPPNCFGGEPMFIPRSSDPSTPEDDGYVLTYMHNEETCKSELLVLDATSPSLEMIASIKIPSRVPYGFHGTFITMSELEDQKSSII